MVKTCHAMKIPDFSPLGRNRDFTLELYFDPLSLDHMITLIGILRQTATLDTNLYPNIQRLYNTLKCLPTHLQNTRDRLSNTRQQLEEALATIEKSSPYEEGLPNPPVSLSSMLCWI